MSIKSDFEFFQEHMPYDNDYLKYCLGDFVVELMDRADEANEKVDRLTWDHLAEFVIDKLEEGGKDFRYKYETDNALEPTQSQMNEEADNDAPRG